MIKANKREKLKNKKSKMIVSGKSVFKIAEIKYSKNRTLNKEK